MNITYQSIDWETDLMELLYFEAGGTPLFHVTGREDSRTHVNFYQGALSVSKWEDVQQVGECFKLLTDNWSIDEIEHTSSEDKYEEGDD